MLFSDAPKALVEKVEQTVRLIRSKGVGVYFITQTPSDMPDSVLGQLGNRVQHALRAYTPKDQKALKAAAQSFRTNPDFDTETAIAELATGEALVSFLDVKGAPSPVERAYVLPPQSQIGPLESAEREQMIKSSILYRFYAETQDRESAFEIISEYRSTVLTEKEKAALEKEKAAKAKEEEKLRKEQEKIAKAEAKEKQKASKERQKFFSSIAKTVVLPLAKTFVNAFFGSSKKKK